MYKTLQKTQRALGGAVLLLCASTAFAGAPEGHPDSIDPMLVTDLRTALSREGYLYRDFKILISMYLRDNRDRFIEGTVPDGQQIDAIVCLLVGKGYRDLERFASSDSFRNWCNHYIRPLKPW